MLNYSEVKEHQKVGLFFYDINASYFVRFCCAICYWICFLRIYNKINAILRVHILISYLNFWPRSQSHGFWPRPQKNSLASASFSPSHSLASALALSFSGLINKPVSNVAHGAWNVDNTESVTAVSFNRIHVWLMQPYQQNVEPRPDCWHDMPIFLRVQILL